MLRANYARELAAWTCLPLMVGAVEGGLTGVIAKSYFATTVSPRALNLAVAILAGAPAFANVISFLWAAVSHGRPKIRMVVGLQAATAVCVLGVALAQQTGAGLLLVIGCVVGARLCWSGVVTLRSTVWRANYPRHTRARLAGKLATVQALTMTAIAVVIGLAMMGHVEGFRVMYPIAAAGGFVGAWIYSGLRVRGQRALMRAERDDGDNNGSSLNPLSLRRVLLADGRFRRYMTCMFVFGSGNLMVTAPLVIMLKDRFELNPFSSILIASSIRTLLMPVSIPIWSRLLDRVHIIRFRSVHSWVFTTATLLYLLGAVTGRVELLWLGAIVTGLAFGGGVLAWNLGHHDFVPPQRAGQYMGVHVTLTGIRGLLAPVIGVSLYEILEWRGPGLGAWTFAACLGLNLIGSIWFMAMHRALSGPGCDSEPDTGLRIEA